jgi:hypothetical protein
MSLPTSSKRAEATVLNQENSILWQDLVKISSSRVESDQSDCGFE